jgi:hypothetical protein
MMIRKGYIMNIDVDADTSLANGTCLLADGGEKTQDAVNKVICASIHAVYMPCMGEYQLEHLKRLFHLWQVQRRLILALVLALIFMIVEVAGGFIANR